MLRAVFPLSLLGLTLAVSGCGSGRAFVIPLATVAYLQPILEVTFGDNGVLLRWTVFDKRDTNEPNVFTAGNCSPHPYASYSRNVDSKKVYYATGNHGDSAWTCAMPDVGVGLWVEDAPGRPSAATVMRMVATASP